MKSAASFIISGVLAVCFPVIGAPGECAYQTLIGRAVTFAGENVPVAQAVFRSPQAIASGSDGSIYVADTGNNRIRRISPEGVVTTVAGTGEASFSGDGQSALKGALNQPAGLAIGPNGVIYIADTANHRVRALAEGTIRTIAGNGRASFTGDGGPAIEAALNKPTSLAVDSKGNLLIVDSRNHRVRRVDAAGKISTIAGSCVPTDRSVEYGPCGGASEAGLATQVPLYGISSVKTSNNGEVFIRDSYAIWRLDQDGFLQPYIRTGEPKLVTGPTALANLSIGGGTLLPLPDGTQAIATRYQLLKVSGGVVTVWASTILISDLAVDPTSGGVLSIGAGDDRIQLDTGPSEPSRQILRHSPAGVSTLVYRTQQVRDVAAAAPRSLTLSLTGAVAVAPDRTIYAGDATPDGPLPGRILAIAPGGSVRVAATLSGVPSAIAIDSNGGVFFSVGNSRQIYKLTNGVGAVAYTMNAAARALGFDAQNRLYVLQADRTTPLLRVESSGSQTVMLRQGGFDYWAGSLASGYEPTPMAIAADGSAYLGVSARFADVLSQVLLVPPTGNPRMLPMERRAFPANLALSSSGGLVFSEGGVIRKILTDGVLTTVYGRDGRGFWGENGFDSAPNPPVWRGLAWDGENALIVIDSGEGAIRRVSLSGCAAEAGPSITGVAESATGNTSLPLTAGQLFSIYGLRLGPAQGVAGSFDETGHLPSDTAGVRVMINGYPAPLLYAGPNQINAIVPYGLDGRTEARITVSAGGRTSDTYVGSISYFGPAIFSVPTPDGPPDRPAAVMINADGTLNGPKNPARSGSVVTVYATGTGAIAPAGEDGKRAELPLKYSALPVQIRFGSSQTGEVLYAGAAPFLVEGTTQINVRIPKFSGASSSASRSASLTIGMGANPVQWFGSVLFYYAD